MDNLHFIESMLRIYVCIYALSHISPMAIYAANFSSLPTTRFRRYWRISTGFIRVFCHLAIVILVYTSLVRAVIAVGTMNWHGSPA